jgi:2-polyprenyl-3-methyl-5-hydroxy-6-metoxy-1,4-benzoquinol methylase
MKCAICAAEVHERRLRVCDADRGEVAFYVVQCPHCWSGRIVDPPTSDELAKWYGVEYYGRGESKFAAPLQAIVDWSVRRRAHRILDRLRVFHRPMILDIGCGRGALLVQLAAAGARGIGLERSASAPPAVGVEIQAGELVDQRFPSGHFDAVIIWHVFEHLQDPMTVLDEVARVLVPGGLLLVAVPNSASWQARVFGARWFHVDAPRHLHHFGHVGLKTLLARRGFDIVESSTSDPMQNIFGFVQSALNQLPGAAPNRMYQLMRSGTSARERAELLLWMLPACLLALPALLEFVISAAVGRGASSIVYARRRAG